MADAGSIWVKLGLKDQQFQKGLSSVTGQLTKIAGIAGVAFGAKQIFDYGREAMALAGTMEGVRAAFDRLNAPDLLANLQKATRGTVDNLSLMKAAVRANNFKVPLDKLASFFEFATKRSAQTGESVDYLVNSIVDGIGRKSTLVMDNLGISAAELQNEIKKTGDFGKAAGNIIERELAKAGDVATTSAQRTASWAATLKNVQIMIGGELNKVLNALAPLIDSLMKSLIDGFNWTKTAMVDVINYFIDLYNESTLFRGTIEYLWATFKTLWDVVKLTFNNIVTSLKRVGTIIKLIFTGNFDDALAEIKKGFTDQVDDYKNFGKSAADNYKKAWLNTFVPREKVSLISLSDEEKKEVTDSYAQAGKAAGKAFSNEVSIDLSDLDTDKLANEAFNSEDALFEEIDLQNELAEIEQLRNQNQIDLANSIRERQGAVTEGYLSIADAVSQMANGIANAKDNWAAMGAIVLSGVVKMVPAIQNVIKATKALFLAKQAEGVAGAVSSGAGVPFPGNLIAIASGVAAVLGTIAPFVGSFKTGTDFVPYDGLAYLHRGEAVVPRHENQGGNGMGKLIAVVSGTDLKFILDEQNRIEGNTL